MNLWKTGLETSGEVRMVVSTELCGGNTELGLPRRNLRDQRVGLPSVEEAEKDLLRPKDLRFCRKVGGGSFSAPKTLRVEKPNSGLVKMVAGTAATEGEEVSRARGESCGLGNAAGLSSEPSAE